MAKTHKSKHPSPLEAVFRLVENGNTFRMAESLQRLVLLYQSTSIDPQDEIERVVSDIDKLGAFLDDINTDFSHFINENYPKNNGY